MRIAISKEVTSFVQEETRARNAGFHLPVVFLFYLSASVHQMRLPRNDGGAEEAMMKNLRATKHGKKEVRSKDRRTDPEEIRNSPEPGA